MASAMLRAFVRVPRSLVFSSQRSMCLGPDPLEHATGLEKKELLAHAAGNDNPFEMKVYKRGVGTKDQPNIVPSAEHKRIIGCICEEDAVSVQWMWLHEGENKRCGCGHWFKLDRVERLSN